MASPTVGFEVDVAIVVLMVTQLATALVLPAVVEVVD
jgi:hypothetical protein